VSSEGGFGHPGHAESGARGPRQSPVAGNGWRQFLETGGRANSIPTPFQQWFLPKIIQKPRRTPEAGVHYSGCRRGYMFSGGRPPRGVPPRGGRWGRGGKGGGFIGWGHRGGGGGGGGIGGRERGRAPPLGRKEGGRFSTGLGKRHPTGGGSAGAAGRWGGIQKKRGGRLIVRNPRGRPFFSWFFLAGLNRRLLTRKPSALIT